MNNKTILPVLIVILLNIFSKGIIAQDDHEDDHHHHKNEVSIAVGVLPLPEENKVTAGLHLHYIRGIGVSNRFGIGAAFETIFDEHKHYVISAAFEYRIYKGLIAGYGPGLLIIKENDKNKLLFAQHFELAWEFEIGKFHIGPLVEVGIGDEVHYMIGVHFGLDF